MVSVICPVLNESPFIRAWCENVIRFSDDIHVFDCGSTDGTREILEQYPICIHENLKRYAEAIWRPYLWQEGEIRNELIDHCRHDWIVNLDADELFGQKFIDALPELVKTKQRMIRFLHYQFWYSVNLIRVRQLKKDWLFRFYPTYQVRMFRNGIKYATEGNHAPLIGGTLPNRVYSRRTNIPFYHYHHLYRKINDNRADDINQGGVKLVTYFGEHPEEVRFYDWFQGRKIEIPARTDERIRQLAINLDDCSPVGKG